MRSRYFIPEPDAHIAWTKVKTSAMRRPRLDCGCANDGRETYLHLGCPRIACRKHADDPHECQPPEPEQHAQCCDLHRHFGLGHGGGVPCSAPAFAVDGTSYTVIDETHHITPCELEAMMNRYSDPERRHFERYWLNNWTPAAEPEPDAPLLDAAREPVHDEPRPRRRWWFW